MLSHVHVHPRPSADGQALKIHLTFALPLFFHSMSMSVICSCLCIAVISLKRDLFASTSDWFQLATSYHFMSLQHCWPPTLVASLNHMVYTLIYCTALNYCIMTDLLYPKQRWDLSLLWVCVLLSFPYMHKNRPCSQWPYSPELMLRMQQVVVKQNIKAYFLMLPFVFCLSNQLKECAHKLNLNFYKIKKDCTAAYQSRWFKKIQLHNYTQTGGANVASLSILWLHHRAG